MSCRRTMGVVPIDKEMHRILFRCDHLKGLLKLCRNQRNGIMEIGGLSLSFDKDGCRWASFGHDLQRYHGRNERDIEVCGFFVFIGSKRGVDSPLGQRAGLWTLNTRYPFLSSPIPSYHDKHLQYILHYALPHSYTAPGRNIPTSFGLF